MVDKEYTHLALVVDRSGSMAQIRTDMNGAIDTVLKEQAEQPGKILVDINVFDTVVEKLFEGVEAKDIDASDLIRPRGFTALLDAIGETVVSLGERLEKLPEEERPGKVIIAVVTDGYENASVDWNEDTVRELVKEQEAKYQWEFLFLGANIDSAKVAKGYGISRSANYTADSAGASHASFAMSGYVTASRLYDPNAYLAQQDEVEEDSVKS